MEPGQPTGQKKITISRGSVVWSNIYRKPGRGFFGDLFEEGVNHIETDNVLKDNSPEWERITDFEYNV